MHNLLQILGAFVAVAVIGLAVVIGIGAKNPANLLPLLPLTIGGVIGGMLLYAFGATLEQLIGIRAALEERKASAE